MKKKMQLIRAYFFFYAVFNETEASWSFLWLMFRLHWFQLNFTSEFIIIKTHANFKLRLISVGFKNKSRLRHSFCIYWL